MLPLVQKLVNYDKLETYNNLLITEALFFIQQGGNPRVLPDLLMGFVPPKKRSKLASS